VSARLSVLHVLAPAPAGGLERVVRALAHGQALRGHAVTVAAVVQPTPHGTTGRGESNARALDGLRSPGVNVVPIVVPGRGYAGERRAIVTMAQEGRAQVAHTHGYRPDVVDAGALRGAGLPTVTTVHGFTGGGWRNRLYERLQRRAFRRFEAVVAVSEPMARLLTASGVPTSRLHMIPNAYAAKAPPVARTEARALLGIANDAWVVGWVGRLSREKGLDVLLDAMAAWRNPSVVLAVIGDGRERERLDAQARERGVASAVRWLGLVPEAGTLYRAFDVFALSSRTEGTPIALFEAMDAGVPIVATSVGGVPAVVSPTEALLVPSERPTALAAALRAIHGDPRAAAERAAAARQRLVEHYAVEPWIDRYDAVYRAVTEGLIA
jgi:glycosyltransferase involved in cell wall biosynthesis